MSARSFLGSWGSGPPSSAPSASGPASARRPGTPTGGDGLGRLLTDARAGVARPAAGVVFVSGTLATRIGQVAALVRDVWKGVPALVVPGAGVIAERGEVEGASAASGVLWAGGRATPFAVGESAGGFRDGLVAAATEAGAPGRAPPRRRGGRPPRRAPPPPPRGPPPGGPPGRPAPGGGAGAPHRTHL